MSLSLPALRAQRPIVLVFLRSQATLAKPKVNVEKIGDSLIAYSRNWSRDKKLLKSGLTKTVAPPLKGDTPFSFMFRRLGHAYEVYPLVFLASTWFVFCLACIYYSFNKIEVFIDRRNGNETPGHNWEAIRDNYFKQATVAFDPDGRTRKRCELMEMLQDEMLEAAKRRGTR